MKKISAKYEYLLRYYSVSEKIHKIAIDSSTWSKETGGELQNLYSDLRKLASLIEDYNQLAAKRTNK